MKWLKSFFKIENWLQANLQVLWSLWGFTRSILFWVKWWVGLLRLDLLTYLHTPESFSTFLMSIFFHLSLFWHSLWSGKSVLAFSLLHHRFRGLPFGRFPTKSSLYTIWAEWRNDYYLSSMNRWSWVNNRYDQTTAFFTNNASNNVFNIERLLYTFILNMIT